MEVYPRRPADPRKRARLTPNVSQPRSPFAMTEEPTGADHKLVTYLNKLAGQESAGTAAWEVSSMACHFKARYRTCVILPSSLPA